jgi:YgiT-type zinc finger domain-containing protein
MSRQQEEHLIEKNVTYTLQMKGRVYIVENVPARVDEETGEQFFSPETVEQLRAIILKQAEKPKRFTETPVYEYQGVAG